MGKKWIGGEILNLKVMPSCFTHDLASVNSGS